MYLYVASNVRIYLCIRLYMSGLCITVAEWKALLNGFVSPVRVGFFLSYSTGQKDRSSSQ